MSPANDTRDSESFVTIDGVRFFVRDVGDRDRSTVLFLSGLGFASWCWNEAMAALAGEWRAITFDNRGAGRSDKPAGPYRIEQMADDAARVLDALDVGAAHVVGNSMGGYIALLMAMRHSARVRSLVLVGTSHGGEGAVGLPEDTMSGWRAAARLPPRESAELSTSFCFPEGWPEANPQRYRAIIDRLLAFPTPHEAWLAQFNACLRFFVPGVDVSGIAQPALVVHGTHDRMIPYPNGTRLAAALERSRQPRRMHTFEGLGHVPYLERPAEFHDVLRAFLREVEAS